MLWVQHTGCNAEYSESGKCRREESTACRVTMKPSMSLAGIDILYQDVDRSYGLVKLCACIMFHSVDKLRRKAVAE